MSQLRTFIAIEFAPQIQDAIGKQITALQQVMVPKAIRWVPKENLHLTLKFLGELSPSHLEFIRQAISQEAASISPFEIQAGGLGAFPTLRNPRVIWVGLHGPGELIDLHKGLDESIGRLGFPRDDRKFSPHLTIGRVHPSTGPVELKKIHEVLASRQLGNIGQCKVDAIHLFKSDLTSSGAIYTKIYSANLNHKR